MNYSDYRVRKYWGEAELIEYFYNLGFWDSLLGYIFLLGTSGKVAPFHSSQDFIKTIEPDYK